MLNSFMYRINPPGCLINFRYVQLILRLDQAAHHAVRSLSCTFRYQVWLAVLLSNAYFTNLQIFKMVRYSSDFIKSTNLKV